MGVEGTCRSGNRGGCPLSCAHYIAGIPVCPLVFPFPAYHQGKTHQKRGKSKDIFAGFGVFSGNRETQKGKILIYS